MNLGSYLKSAPLGPLGPLGPSPLLFSFFKFKKKI